MNRPFLKLFNGLRSLLLLLLSGLTLVGCELSSEKYIKKRDMVYHLAEGQNIPGINNTATTAFTLRSSSFLNARILPTKHANTTVTGGQNLSPQLNWSNAPLGTRSFAIVMRDESSGNFIHWGIYNIPGNATQIHENIGQNIPSSIDQTENDFGDNGYGGPGFIPHGITHKYVITIYALPWSNIGANLTYSLLSQVVAGAIGQASLVVYFSGTGT